MAVAGGAVVVFKRLRQPSILGYLLAGILVGPFTFPNAPVTNIEIVRLLADLGLVLLLFAVGMEFGWRRIRQVGLGVLLIGSIEMLVMVSIGYQLGRLLGWTPVEAIYLGSAMAISSSAILIKVLRDSGKLTTRVGKLVVGLLVVEDFVAVILLTLLSGLATSGATSFGDVGPLVLKLVLFTVASVALGAVFVPRLLSYINKFESPETLVLAALALCFALALIGEELGLSAAAGAFLIGAVIGDTPAGRADDQDDLTHKGHVRGPVLRVDRHADQRSRDRRSHRARHRDRRRVHRRQDRGQHVRCVHRGPARQGADPVWNADPTGR